MLPRALTAVALSAPLAASGALPAVAAPAPTPAPANAPALRFTYAYRPGSTAAGARDASCARRPVS